MSDKSHARRPAPSPGSYSHDDSDKTDCGKFADDVAHVLTAEDLAAGRLPTCLVCRRSVDRRPVYGERGDRGTGGEPSGAKRHDQFFGTTGPPGTL